METRYVAWRPSHDARRALAVIGICLLSTACGDTAHRLGGGEDGKTEGDADSVTTIHKCAQGQLLEPIDDMEDNNGSIELTAGRAGVWFAFNDHTGTQEPDIFAETFTMSRVEPSRGDSHYAAHTSGSGFTEWGAGVGVDLRVQQPYDASGYAGISFWARRGPGIDFFELQLQVPDSATSPLAGQCEAELCHDDFGDLIGTLTEEWQYYSYTWDQMIAQDWSEQAKLRNVTRVTPSAIYGIRFQVENKYPAFDFWIDDMSFLCRN